MAKRKHGRVAVRRKLPSLFELLRKDQARVLAVLSRHGVCFDAGTFITMSAPLEKVAAYHAVPDKKKFLAELLGR
ncbi:MAG: hypothetical protein ACHQ49_06465 [Elusimicrobiota bacterium]